MKEIIATGTVVDSIFLDDGIAKLYKPVKVEANCWYCRYTIKSKTSKEAIDFSAYGVDSLQSLSLAIEMMKEHFRQIGKKLPETEQTKKT
jgi:hypothetical protein